MEVYQTVNNHRKSNSYFLKVSESEIVIIDVGDFDINCFQEWLFRKDFKLIAVILTHEHSDHCLGLNQLSQISDFDLYVSKYCKENIKNPKKNYSEYIEEIATFSVTRDSIVVKDYSNLLLGTSRFTFLETPGHSPGSMCISVNNFLFSGDTLMVTKTPLQFPDSSKTEYKKSLLKIKKIINNKTIICPGHGECFLPGKILSDQP